MRFLRRLVACVYVSALLLGAQPALAKKHLFIHFALGPGLQAPVSGRLLVFVAPGSGAKDVDANPFAPSEVYVAAKEVRGWSAASMVDLDADDLVYPAPLSDAKAGDYQLRAVLDVAHNYNYSGRSSGDLVSEVVTLSGWSPGQGIAQTAVLSRVLPETAAAGRDETIQEFSFLSRSLTQFWGREIYMRGVVVAPPSYKAQTKQKFPTVYYTHGFGGQLK